MTVISRLCGIFGMKPDPVICFIGTAVYEGKTLLNSLKTHEYSPQESSIHPSFERGFKLGSLTVKILILDAHEGSRRSFQQDLHNYIGNALVYIMDSDRSNDERDSRAKQEIQDILDLSEISAVPILILALSQTGSETVEDVARNFDLQEINLQQGVQTGRLGPVGLFVACLPLNQGYQEAFDWLLTHM